MIKSILSFFWVWIIIINTMISRFVHFPANDMISFFLMVEGYAVLYTWQISRLISWLSWAVLDAQGSSPEKLSSERTNNPMCCICLDCVLSSQHLRRLLLKAHPSGLSVGTSPYPPFTWVFLGSCPGYPPQLWNLGQSSWRGRRCRSNCIPKYERAQSQCANQEGAALGFLNSYTPWIQILLLYPVPHRFPLSSASIPQTFILFYFFNSHLFGRNIYCKASKQSYTFISFNLSGLFVEEGRDSNRGETRSKGIKQEGGRRVRKGIQRGEVNTRAIWGVIWNPTTVEASYNIYIHERSLNGITK